MGMAHLAPVSDRKFHYWITDHAVQRFRERVDPSTGARLDYDLAMLLDERIHQALQNNNSTVVIDADAPDEDTRVVQIDARDGQKCFVVMRMFTPNGYPRANTLGGPGSRAPGTVTILTSEMASRNYASRQWKIPNRPFAAALAKAPAIPAPAPKPIAAGGMTVHIKPVTPDAPAPKPAPVLAPEKDREYARGASKVERFEWIKSVLRERPNIKFGGPDGINAMAKARFGSGVTSYIVDDLRKVVAAEGKPATTPGPYHRPAATPSVAEQLAAAIQKEAEAKTAYDRAIEVARAMVDKAQEAKTAASIEVEELMKKLTEMRK